MTLFNFRLIDTGNGTQIIDRDLSTPLESLTPAQQVEYKQVESSLLYIDLQKKKKHREAERKRKITYKLFHKLACVCGIIQKKEWL